MKTVLYHCILEEEIHFICSIPLYWNLSSVFIREIRGVILFGKSVDFYQQDSEVKKKKRDINGISIWVPFHYFSHSDMQNNYCKYTRYLLQVIFLLKFHNNYCYIED